ncbi:hypothetical protein RQP46_007534 [Phenoliferia psychrophenolica]
MSESPDERGSVELQPKVASFAPELIDAVIDHLGPGSLKPYSLISRNWRGPVQRRRMQWLVIRSGTRAEQVADRVIASGLQVFVHTLEFEGWRTLRYVRTQAPTPGEIKDDDGVALDHFLALLPLFPNLQSLHLEPNFTHFNPSAIAILHSAEVLPRLSSLHVETNASFRDVELVHDLLVLTPNLSQLSLISHENSTSLRFIPNRRPPAVLPHLQSLRVAGEEFASRLVALALLSPSTISQISFLAYDDDGNRGDTPIPLLTLAGPTLKTLEYTTFADEVDLTEELGLCGGLEHMILNAFNGSTKEVFPQLPASTRTVTVPNLYVAHSVLNDIASPHAALKKVVLQDDNDRYYSDPAEEKDRMREVAQACERRKLELVDERPQPKIASFAPELIDAVIDHLGPESLKPYSLISRNWRGPVQRRRMRLLIVKSGTRAEEVADGVIASGLHVYVHTLDLKCWRDRQGYSRRQAQAPTPSEIKDDDGVALNHFLALLPLFPNVRALRLEPAFTHFYPSALTILRSSEVLPRLSSLHVETNSWFRDVELVHDLLVLTPNISDLSLATGESRGVPRLRRNQKPPVVLPRLRSLRVLGAEFAARVTTLALLSPSTIAQITFLAYDDDGSRGDTSIPLLMLAGPTLKTLDYTTFAGECDLTQELGLCPSVEHIILNLFNGSSERVIQYLPATTHTVTVPNLYAAHSFLNDIASPPAAPKKVILEEDEAYDYYSDSEEEKDRMREVVQACERGQIELVVKDQILQKLVEEMD